MLPSCAYKKLDANLHYLEGQKIDTAINYLGVPDDKFMIENREAYIWGQNKNTRQETIRPFGGYSTSGGVFGGVGIVFGKGAGDRSYTQRCTVKALTDETGIIQKMEYQPNAGGCERFTKAMTALERDFHDGI